MSGLRVAAGPRGWRGWEWILSVAGLALMLARGVLVLVAGWKMYVQAGQHGWVALIPLVSIVVTIIILNELSKAFGYGIGMTILLILLLPIGYLVLGYGSAEYRLQPDRLFG